MVKNPGAAGRPGSIRALNHPVPVEVRSGDDGLPQALRLRGKWLTVEAVADYWRIDDEWWRGHPVSRIYYRCVADQGMQATVFRDLATESWYLQKA